MLSNPQLVALTSRSVFSKTFSLATCDFLHGEPKARGTVHVEVGDLHDRSGIGRMHGLAVSDVHHHMRVTIAKDNVTRLQLRGVVEQVTRFLAGGLEGVNRTS